MSMLRMILTNHMGYMDRDGKTALLQAEEAFTPLRFRVLRQDGKVLYEGTPRAYGPVGRWGTGSYWLMEFTEVREHGLVYIEAEAPEEAIRSQLFEITGMVRDMRLINAGVSYFKAQRATGEWDAADRHVSFRGGYREGTVDAHGGWWDASGDVGKHLSHLSHTGWCNPQQTAFSVYALLRLYEVLGCEEQYGIMRRRILDEATYGADFLMRMRAPSGSFFRSVSRRDSFAPVSDNRALQMEFRRSSGQFEEGFKAPTEGEEQVTDAYYETSLRSGGGTAIAALACVARHPYPGSDFHTDAYLTSAKEAYRYLREHNAEYTNDGKWNIVDTYCALLAAAELYQTSGETGYLRDARNYAGTLIEGMKNFREGHGKWFVRENGEPFYHAADEGLPLVALAVYSEAEPDSALKERAVCAMDDACSHISAGMCRDGNPFSYPRYTLCTAGGLAERFFFPHDSPASPWWQGDNARICSLAAGLLMAGCSLGREKAEGAVGLAQNVFNWILGLNPFDACMMEGYGRNNIQYSFHGRYDFLACPGGIVNGITSAPEDEEGICFCTDPQADGTGDNWRWAEQWQPHASWFLLAMGYCQKARKAACDVALRKS